MGNILRTIVTWILCLFLSFVILFILSSSWFTDDDQSKEIAKINEHYSVINDIGAAPDYGFMIHSTLAGFVAKNCDEIYYGRDTIMYSCTLYAGSQDTSYYIIPIKPERKDGLENSPVQIKKATFKKNIVRFNKVILPDATR